MRGRGDNSDASGPETSRGIIASPRRETDGFINNPRITGPQLMIISSKQAKTEMESRF